MIYIIRHGQRDYNVLEKITGRIDISLNDNGIKEVYEAKDVLKDIKFDYVFASPLERTMETARIITDEKIIKDERLIERFNGEVYEKRKMSFLIILILKVMIIIWNQYLKYQKE